MWRIGTSGWQYADWRGRFYPSGLGQNRWLEHYVECFSTVELNVTFYRLPKPDTFGQWARRVPPDFLFAAKMSRYLTHVKRLVDPAEPVARFLAATAGLGNRLGPVLLQLPPNLPAAPDRLDAVLAEIPDRMRVVVEPRHASWWSKEVRDVLVRRGAALCWSDRRARPVAPLWRTADFGYLRLHEGRARPWPRYGQRSLDTWLGRLTHEFSSQDCFVYFNNDQHGAAIEDALAMTRRAIHLGCPVFRPRATGQGEANTRECAVRDLTQED
jgi:uncharacterized protein YecE (DUF72 family)